MKVKKLYAKSIGPQVTANKVNEITMAAGSLL